MTNNEAVYDANVRVRDLPREVDHVLNMLATMRQVHKWEVIRDALREYAERHRKEATEFTRAS